MGDSSDFTFSPVGLQVDDHHLESPKPLPNIQSITLEDNPSDFQNIHNVDDSNRSDSSCDHAASKDVGSTDSSSNFSSIQPPKFNLNKPITRKPVDETGDSVNGPQEQKPVIKKPVARAKVPFEKGYSQMDWLKLTRTASDLAGYPALNLEPPPSGGLKGQSNRRLISMDEVKQHKDGGSIWTVLKGRVYNISPYMKFHPGDKYHAWVNAEFLLEKCLVGVLDAS